MGILAFLLLLPLFGAALIAVMPSDAGRLIRGVALAAAAVTLALSWGLLAGFDSSIAGLQFQEMHRWNPRLGTSFALGADGFSLPMVLLATLLSFIAILASGSRRKRIKGYYLLLLLEAAMLGVFMAQDWALFYVFWELTLIPLFILIDRWGGNNRHGAALNFALYTMGGSVFMLVSLLVLYDAVPSHSFAMADIAAAAKGLSEHTQVLIFLGFLIGFGVKMPIFPLHGWLPLAHVEAPSPVSILLSGVLLKMGSYGLIRVSGSLPDAVLALQAVLVALALISLLYGGLLAWKQSDLKAMIAYSSVSHMGVVLLGIAALNVAGLAALFGVVLGAAYFLNIYRRAFLGPVGNNAISEAVDLRPRELFLVSVLGLWILIAGIYPDGVLDLSRVAGEQWMARLQGAELTLSSDLPGR